MAKKYTDIMIEEAVTYVDDGGENQDAHMLAVLTEFAGLREANAWIKDSGTPGAEYRFINVIRAGGTVRTRRVVEWDTDTEPTDA